MKTIAKTGRAYRLAVDANGPKQPYLPLAQIHHVAHLATAMRILEDRTVAARRVDDDSRLDEHLVSVVWTAPNRWGAKGSRYGTVEFSFDFAELVRGRELYWVEEVRGRRLATCRMLISDRKVSGLPLRRYDPSTSKGPIRLIDGVWFWRSDMELELMFHGDLPLSRCDGLDVVPHNRDHCGRGSAYRCSEVGRGEMETAAMILAGALCGRYRLPSTPLESDGRPSLLLQRGWHGILDALDDDMAGAIRRKDEVDLILAAALTRLSAGDRQQAAELASLISSPKRLRSSLSRLLGRRAKLRIESPHSGTLRLVDAAAVTVHGALPSRRARHREGTPGRASGSTRGTRVTAGRSMNGVRRR